jgi:hypothetical protein
MFALDLKRCFVMRLQLKLHTLCRPQAPTSPENTPSQLGGIVTTTFDILNRGYFPKELPPPFSTESFARAYRSLRKSKTKESLCVRYSYSKYASVRRTLAIPNPAHMIELADVVARNWNALCQHCSKSPYSRTTPQVGTDRAITGRHSLDQIAAARAEIRTGARYILKADVANFFGSIYTHAIPWAFHSKAVAKANRQTKASISKPTVLFGNLLDAAFSAFT